MIFNLSLRAVSLCGVEEREVFLGIMTQDIRMQDGFIISIFKKSSI
jgi:hypothetical protein